MQEKKKKPKAIDPATSEDSLLGRALSPSSAGGSEAAVESLVASLNAIVDGLVVGLGMNGVDLDAQDRALIFNVLANANGRIWQISPDALKAAHALDFAKRLHAERDAEQKRAELAERERDAAIEERDLLRGDCQDGEHAPWCREWRKMEAELEAMRKSAERQRIRTEQAEARCAALGTDPTVPMEQPSVLATMAERLGSAETERDALAADIHLIHQVLRGRK